MNERKNGKVERFRDCKNRFCHFIVSRMIYEILSHKYDIISGIFPKYLQMTKKINSIFQHNFSILHGSILDSLLRIIVWILGSWGNKGWTPETNSAGNKRTQQPHDCLRQVAGI